MEINTGTIAAYKELITKPAAHGFDFKPLSECLVKSETVTAKHILFQNYIDLIKKPLPKIFFYIILEEIFGQPTGKDDRGDLGYHLKVNN